MRLTTFRANGHWRIGRLTGDGQATEPFDLGDVVHIEIGDIGGLENPIVARERTT